MDTRHRGLYHVSTLRPLGEMDPWYRKNIKKVPQLSESHRTRLLARHDHTYDKTSSPLRALQDHSYCCRKGVRVGPRRVTYNAGLPQDLACHTKLTMYSCPSCPYTSEFVASIRLHRLHLHCNLQFAEYLDYIETCYVCDLCNFQTYSQLFILTHDCPKTYGFTSWYCCSLCDFKSSHSEALGEHQSKTHFSVFRPLRLQYGQGEVKLGNQKYVNAQHNKNETTQSSNGMRLQNGLWQCPLCTFKIGDKKIMVSHYMAHSQLKVNWFQCGRCKFKTKRPELMKKHSCDMRIEPP